MAENFIKISLPSKNKTYTDVGEEGISIRALKGKEEMLIAEITNENFEKKFLAILKSVMKGIDPAKLTLGDRKYVLVWLTINSISKMQRVAFNCQVCSQPIEVDVDMSAFKVIELPDEFTVPHEIKLSNGVVRVRLLTVEDEVKVADYQNLGKNAWLYRYALSIVDKEKTPWAWMEELENMSSADIALIRAFQEKFDHGPDMISDYECPKCGGSGRVAVPFRIEMLFPYGKALKDTFGPRV